MDKVIGVKLLHGCSGTDIKDAVRTLEDWFCAHGKWVFACQDDIVQKLLCSRTKYSNNDELKSIADYAGKRFHLINGVFDCKAKLYRWLHEQGRINRGVILEDCLESALLSVSVRNSVDLIEQADHTMANFEILAIRIDPLFARAETSLEEFTNDRQQCYRKCIEHGERILERLIEGNLKDVVEEEVVFFPEDSPMNEPPLWFVAPCVNKSIGECLAEALSYDLSELRAIREQNSVCVCDLSTSQHDWNAARAMKIFIRPEELMKFNERSSHYDS